LCILVFYVVFSLFIYYFLNVMGLSVMRRNVAMVKSSKDSRYAKDSIVTHDGVKVPCWALPDLLSFRQKFGDDAYKKV
jgi:thymidine kinase